MEYEQADEQLGKYLLVKIPYRSLAAYRKVSDKIISHLESKFKWPVIVIATRTIQSKGGILFSLVAITRLAVRHKTQMRPRSRNLTAVYDAVLEDVVIFPINLL